ncbi:MAG: WbuC family cupin fold metalloprotein [Verrucomicrobiota bacterium]
MLLAFPNATGDVFTLTPELLQQGFEGSAASPRKRIILPIHRTQDALVQRMLNFFQPGTYVQPHLHPRDHAIETIQVLKGRLGFVRFNEQGGIEGAHDLRASENALLDIEPKLWHGMVCLEPDTVILEIKRGPYNDEDKVFADWAPGEDEEGADTLLEKLAGLFA